MMMIMISIFFYYFFLIYFLLIQASGLITNLASFNSYKKKNRYNRLYKKKIDYIKKKFWCFKKYKKKRLKNWWLYKKKNKRKIKNYLLFHTYTHIHTHIFSLSFSLSLFLFCENIKVKQNWKQWYLLILFLMK